MTTTSLFAGHLWLCTRIQFFESNATEEEREKQRKQQLDTFLIHTTYSERGSTAKGEAPSKANGRLSVHSHLKSSCALEPLEVLWLVLDVRAIRADPVAQTQVIRNSPLVTQLWHNVGDKKLTIGHSVGLDVDRVDAHGSTSML